jgi:adenylyltransferase/sulfurtransferase
MLTPSELATIRQHAEAEYPAECCGLLLVRPGSSPDRKLLPCRNIQDELHARDPERFGRTSRTAYYIAHDDLLAISREQSAGWEVAVIYHSHVDAGAYFSETDRRNALVDGQPTYPGTIYVVVEVQQGRAADVRAFRWDDAGRDFTEVALTAAG